MVDNFCHDLGLLVRPLINVCIMSPPLIITREQIDDLVGALRQALDLTQAALRKAG
jgi:putrescine aminotransferase